MPLNSNNTTKKRQFIATSQAYAELHSKKIPTYARLCTQIAPRFIGFKTGLLQSALGLLENMLCSLTKKSTNVKKITQDRVGL